MKTRNGSLRHGANGSGMSRNGNNSVEVLRTRLPVLITGGSGFIGVNLADRLLSHGQSVVIYDNLSRAGVRHNLDYLRKKHGRLLTFEEGDVRDAAKVTAAPGRKVTQRALDLQDGKVLYLIEKVIRSFRAARRADPTILVPELNKIAWMFETRSGKAKGAETPAAARMEGQGQPA